MWFGLYHTLLMCSARCQSLAPTFVCVRRDCPVWSSPDIPIFYEDRSPKPHVCLRIKSPHQLVFVLRLSKPSATLAQLQIDESVRLTLSVVRIPERLWQQ